MARETPAEACEEARGGPQMGSEVSAPQPGTNEAPAGAYHFVVPGLPRGKGRPKFARVGAGVRAYTDDKTVAYENLVRIAANWKFAPHRHGAEIDVVAEFPFPKSTPKKRLIAQLPHIKRPDADNIVKAVLDGINGVVVADDAQFSAIRVTKRHTFGPPQLIVSIYLRRAA